MVLIISSNFLAIEDKNGLKSKIIYSGSAIFDDYRWYLNDGFVIDVKDKNIDYFNKYSTPSSFKNYKMIEKKYADDKASFLSFYDKVSMILNDFKSKIKNDQIDSVVISLCYDLVGFRILFFNFSLVLVFNFSFERKKNYVSSVVKIMVSFLFLKNLVWLFESITRQHQYITFIILIPPVIGLATAIFLIYAKDLKNEKVLSYVG